MALAYRAASFVSGGNISGGDLSLTKPTGTTDGDVVLILCYFEPDTCAISISPGTWASAEVANTGAFRIKAFWKYASAEPASYTLSNDVAGNQWRTALGVAYSGGTGSGTLLDVPAGTGQADGVVVTSQTAPSVTTLGPDRLVTFNYGNFSGANPTVMAGFATNLRGVLGGCAIADAVKAAAGTTGTSNPSSGPGTEDYAAMHIALISDTPSGAPIGVPIGTPTWGFPHPPRRTA